MALTELGPLQQRPVLWSLEDVEFEQQLSIPPDQSLNMGGGGKVPYPKHVWSPAGGWYAQPSNWRANTAVMATVILGFVTFAWGVSAQLETRTKFPEQGRFFPSRWWSKQIIEHEKQSKGDGQ